MTTLARERIAVGSDQAVTHQLPCMEIWGGNQAIEDAVSVPGIDAWVYSRPVGGQSSGGDIHYVSTCGGG
ncbi:MAG: hypothetical protein GY842_00335, partial [bacterium]|nr:hypothetical protein [bacterium]